MKLQIEKQEEMYKCKSYFDDEDILRDCTCGKCGDWIDKVYGSTEYIEPLDLKIGVLKLKVISLLDFRTKSICFRQHYKTVGIGTITIPYSLEICTNVSEDKKTTKWEIVETITQPIKTYLLGKGYILSKNIN